MMNSSKSLGTVVVQEHLAQTEKLNFKKVAGGL
jgi:hypothetical protein